MSKQPEKKQRGSVNYIRVLGGGYLIYLAYQLFKNAGQSSKPFFGLASAVLFVIAGAWILRIEWKAYKYGMEHIDDPETWSDEDGEAVSEEEELDQLMASAAAMTDDVKLEDEEAPEEECKEEQV